MRSGGCEFSSFLGNGIRRQSFLVLGFPAALHLDGDDPEDRTCHDDDRQDAGGTRPVGTGQERQGEDELAHDIRLLKRDRMDIGRRIRVTLSHQAAIFGKTDESVSRRHSRVRLAERDDVTTFQRIGRLDEDDGSDRKRRLHRTRLDAHRGEDQAEDDDASDGQQAKYRVKRSTTEKFLHWMVLRVQGAEGLLELMARARQGRQRAQQV